MSLRRFLQISSCCVAVSAFAAAPAAAVQRVVDSDGEATPSNCDSTLDTPFTTISLALAAANPGDIIIVCPGTTGVYDEQLLITETVTIRGLGGVMLKPSAMVTNANSLTSGKNIAAAILVVNPSGASTVRIETLIVDGGLNETTNGCADITLGGAANPIGIYFQNASGTVLNSVVRNFRRGAGHEGCQDGLGIFAQGDSGPHTVTVTGTSVHDFQKGGIVANEVGTTLVASENHVTGDGPTTFIAQNGIQVGFGAGGTIQKNVVADVVYSQCTSIEDPEDPEYPDSVACNNGSSTGILIYEGANGTTVSANTVTTSQVGVYLDTDSGTASSNLITNTLVYDGIYVLGDSNIVAQNSVTNSDESGIFVDGTSNSVTKNKINEAPIGIYVLCGVNTVPTTGSPKNTFVNTQQTVFQAGGSCSPSLSLTAQSGSGPGGSVQVAPVQ
jgi:hypothetical protein